MTPLVLLAAALSLPVIFLVVRYYRVQKKLRAQTRQLEQVERELERLQLSFARFTPATLVDKIAAEGISHSADTREVTVLFADIQGFTKLSEGLEPAVLVELLNGFFSRMSNAIEAHHGHVGKFIGDGLMATFGALRHNPWQSIDAAIAALSMRDALSDYNRELAANGLPRLSFGVGIHCGEVVAGILGSENLLEYTVIGDVVNLASRVQALTRSLEADILVTESVGGKLDSRFAVRKMNPAPVKGKSAEVTTYAIDALRPVRE